MPEVILSGPEGRLEARYAHAKEPNAPIAIMLHPHPQHGGNMNNRIVYALYRVFVRRGFSALRFNFRGVGRSEGGFARGEGELSDAAAVLDWLQAYNQDSSQCWIAGFSFGAWIGMQLLMRRPEITGFISIAPPANLYDFSFLAPCPASGLILQGEADELVPHQMVGELAQKLRAQRYIEIDYRVVPRANHFFHGMIDRLTEEVDDYLDTHLKQAVEAAD